MLTELCLKNFKAFGAEMQKVPMSKITLIYGPNSGGKSSIIQSLMLLKQSVEHFDSLPIGSQIMSMRELTHKGDYVDLGSFPTVVHRHDTTRELELALSFDYTDRRRGPVNAYDRGRTFDRRRTYGIRLTFADGNDTNSRDSSFLSRIKYYIARKGKLSTYFDNDEINEVVPEMVRRGGVYDVTDDPDLDYEIDLCDPSPPDANGRFGTWRMSNVKIHWDRVNISARTFNIPLNEDRITTADNFSPLSTRRMGYFPSLDIHPRYRHAETRVARSHLRRRVPTSSRALNAAVGLSTRDLASAGTSPRALKGELALAVSEDARNSGIREVGFDTLDQIIYLGPLRSPPQRSYVVSGGTRASTGIHGQFMPNILYRDDETLQRVNTWFNELELDYELAVPRLSSQVELIGEQASITLLDKRNTEVTLVDVGFGINQVLPVIIEGVASPRGSIICVEQPEIHLHPRLQAKLADMVVETAQEGKQWIIETHSEMLIRQIQTRIADPGDDLTEDDVSVVYVLRGDESSTIKPLEIDGSGEFKEKWPDGFFDDASKKIIEMMRLRRMQQHAN